MSASQKQQDELQALRREVEALRAERESPGANSGRGTMALMAEKPDEASAGATRAATDSPFGDWPMLREAASEIAQELAAVARERPVLGIVGAFAVGLVLGRLLSR